MNTHLSKVINTIAFEELGLKIHHCISLIIKKLKEIETQLLILPTMCITSNLFKWDVSLDSTNDCTWFCTGT